MSGQETDREREQLDEVLAEVTEHPGATAQEVAHAVPARLLHQGRPGVAMTRDRALILLRTLEQDGKVTRRPGQASVGFYPKESEHAE